MIEAGINCRNVYAIKKTALDVAADYVRKRRRVHCTNTMYGGVRVSCI